MDVQLQISRLFSCLINFVANLWSTSPVLIIEYKELEFWFFGNLKNGTEWILSLIQVLNIEFIIFQLI